MSRGAVLVLRGSLTFLLNPLVSRARLPEQYWPNVIPITASLSSDELDAVVAFLQTLSDLYP